MSLNRFNPRRDENELEIRKRFAAHGWHTEQVSKAGGWDLDAYPSIGVTKYLRVGRVVVHVDVKMPKGRLKPAQEKKWAELAAKGIPVYVVRIEADVDALVRGELEPWKPGWDVPLPDGRRLRNMPRTGAKAGRVDYVEAYTPPRSKHVDAAREAEETFAPSPHPDTCRCVTCGPARICE